MKWLLLSLSFALLVGCEEGVLLDTDQWVCTQINVIEETVPLVVGKGATTVVPVERRRCVKWERL